MRNKRGVVNVMRDMDIKVQARRNSNIAPSRKDVPLLRTEIGDVLRVARLKQGKTLRNVSSGAQVSLGYLSEVERGQKEASSELLASICDALGVTMAEVLRDVLFRYELAEGNSNDMYMMIPDSPESLVRAERYR